MTQNDISLLRTNRDLRDDIRDYWSDRAATFDFDPGHRIGSGAERAAWMALFRRHLGDARGGRAPRGYHPIRSACFLVAGEAFRSGAETVR